jgi:hypothetical protein
LAAWRPRRDDDVDHATEAEMIALLVAAGLAASEPSAVLRQPCQAGMLHTADPALMLRPQDWRAVRPRKLGDLPPARAEYTVLRLVRGCMVAAPANWRVPAP